VSRPRVFAIILPLAAALIAVAVALAYWTSSGTGAASAAADTLSAPAIHVPSSGGASITITFDQQASLGANTSKNGTITYTIERKLGSGAYAAIASGGCSGTLAYGTTSCSDSVSADGSYSYRAIAHLGDWTATSSDAGPVSVTLDSTPPTVQSITRHDASPTNATSVHFDVTFSESVTGVDTSDFAVAATGVSGASVSSVTGSGASYSVTVNTGSGSGSLGLNLVDDDTIKDTAGNPLGGAGTTGAGNGSFTGQVYTIDKSAPSVSSIGVADASPTNASTLHFTVVFSEAVKNVAASNFSLTTSGVGGTAPSIASVSPTSGLNSTYTVAVNTSGATGTNSGSIRLDLSSVGTIQDAVGNALSATHTGDQSYAYDTTAPTAPSISIAGTSPTKGTSLTWTVTFNEAVSGVGTSNFGLVTSGIGGTAPSVSSAAPVGGSSPATQWTITVSASGATGTNSGSIQLNLTSTSGIKDAATNALSATTPVAGQSYTFDTTAPTISSISRADSSPTNASSLHWTVAFSEAVNNVKLAQGQTSLFAFATSGLSGTPSFTAVSAAGGTTPATQWTLTAGTSGVTATSGSIGANLANAGQIQDAAGNALGGTLPFTGQAYVYDTVAPSAPTGVSLANGGGNGNAWINGANKSSVNVKVDLPSTSVSTDTATVTLTDGTHTTSPVTAAASSGAGSVTVTGIDASSLTDGSVTIAATATDQAGNVSSAKTGTTSKDTVAPSTPSGFSYTDGTGASGADILNGSAEANSSVRVVETGAASGTFNGTASGLGAFAIQVASVNGNSAGKTVNFSVTATDAAGNASTAATPSFPDKN
jgi:trimeric autotransporter adhesin